jgi:hypothetical protein
MTGKVLQIPPRSLTVATLSYSTNLGSSDAPVIVLGSIGEIVLPRLRGLGLLARTDLTSDETALLGSLAVRMLESPFQYLCREFDAIWEQAAPGGAVRLLSARHSGSLLVSGPMQSNPRDLPSCDGKLKYRAAASRAMNDALHAAFAAAFKVSGVVKPRPEAPLPEESRYRVTPAAAA